jgi:signal transduction histidine kinase
MSGAAQPLAATAAASATARVQGLARLRGLSAKLALFFIALAFPALLLVESTIITVEFRDFMRDVDAGALRRAGESAARELAPRIGREDPAVLADWLGALVVRLANPHTGISAEGAYVLLELSERPLSAAIHDARGALIAASNDVTAPPEAVARALRGEHVDYANSGGPVLVRAVTLPLRDATGTAIGALHLELELPLPWRKLLLELSLEWPIMLAYLLVFGIAMAIFFSHYVTRRLSRIARAADGWSAGDFSAGIGDDSGDELGRLSRRLDQMAQELAGHLATRSRLASLEERQRIARDLHDTVKQKAFALNLQLGAAQSLLERDAAGARVRLGDAAALVEEIQRELASIIVELRQEASDPELAPRAERLAGDWSRRSDIAIEWLRRDAVVAPRWAQDHLLRLLEEALANVWRHSGARRATLSLVGDGTRAELAIADDGRGAASEGEGMGWANMRERAAALPGGRLEIDSRAGAGTRVVVRWNLGESAA